MLIVLITPEAGKKLEVTDETYTDSCGNWSISFYFLFFVPGVHAEKIILGNDLG